MKTMPSLNSLRMFKPTIAAALAIVIAWGFSVWPAQANSYVVTLEQVGPNVVATGSGAIDLTGLSFATNGAGGPVMTPSEAAILTGSSGPDILYRGPISGPTSFGSGGFASGDSGTGDLVGIAANPLGVLPTVYVPTGYVSNSLLSDSATYNNVTFSSLGVIPGTYVWSWGIGADQKFTLEIGAAVVPDSGSAFGLLLVALSSLVFLSRIRSFCLA
jgi:hypothetical protein